MLLTWSHAVMYVRDEAVMLDFYTCLLYTSDAADD